MRITHMTNTSTNYTACYTVEGHLDTTLLQEECRILTGVWAGNVEKHDNPNTTNFTITDSVDDGVDPDQYFDQIGRDLSRYIKSPVTLAEIFVDD